MKKLLHKKQGFTLVELIVVITILAILGTIGFVSFGGFTKNARDSVRGKDIKSIKTSLEVFVSERGILPPPSNSIDITYSGGVVFFEGTFGDSNIQNVRSLNKKPVDPLYGNEYTYAVSSTRLAYNIAWVQEGGDMAYVPLFSQTYADTAQSEVIARVDGNYNGQLVHTSTGNLSYVFFVPSLILSDTGATDILSNTNKFVYNYENNIPFSYKTTGVIQAGNFEFTPKLVYSGSTLPRAPESLKELIENAQNSILGTVLYSKSEYRSLLEIDMDDSNDLFNYGNNFINKQLGGRFQLVYQKNCKEVLGSENDKGSGEYTISPDGINKVKVYCDMETDGGGWTRLRRWERGVGYTDGSDINKTRLLSGNELMTQYTRYGKIRVFTGGLRQDLNVSGEKHGLYYKRFKTRQWDFFNNQNVDCGEHTTISDLISQVAGGTWGNCGRNCPRIGEDPEASCDGSLEYIDIQLDDLGTNIGLTNDKLIEGFYKDPCIANGHKTDDRNISWTSGGVIQHRNDSNTSLTNLGGGDQGQCAGLIRSQSWINDRLTDETNPNGYRHTMFAGADISSYTQGYQTNEVYIR